jgi:hypothetical protein
MCCPPDMAGELWPHVKAYFDSATGRAGDFETDDIERMVFDMSALLWVITDELRLKGALVTRLYTTRGQRVCEVVAIGGDGLPDWKHLIADIEQFAMNEGCQKVRLSGRKGWSRVFPDYSTICVTLEKRIDNAI